MFSKNFIFTALFFATLLLCISCLGNKSENIHQQSYTILPTDSSNFTNSLDKIEIIKTSAFSLNGKWIVDRNSTSKENLYMTFEGRKIYSNIDRKQNKLYAEYQTFAFYDKCPDNGGMYDKNGKFLVIGSGNEECICYEILKFSPQKMILYNVNEGAELEFDKKE